jgi:hypothetical protein
MGNLSPVGFRLESETLQLLDSLADHYKTTRVAALRFAIREAAKGAGLPVPALTPHDLERRAPRRRD